MQPDGTLVRGGSAVHLTPKELAALRLLIAHAGQIVTPAQLKAALWEDVHVTPDSVPRCISSLRARLGDESCIETLYKRGYRLTCPVHRERPEERGSLPRLAIVPFTDAHGEGEGRGRAIAEDTAARLTALRPALVHVLARDSVFTLAAKGLTAEEIGQKLRADMVLTGMLHSSTSNFLLRAEMICIQDGTQIWVEEILVPRDRAAALQTELLMRLAYRLGRGRVSETTNEASDPMAAPNAYELFLRGHTEWESMERHRMEDGTQLLARAVELAPELITARIDLVHACVTQAVYGFLPPRVAAERLRRAAERIPDVEETAPVVLPALGWTSFHIDRDLASALELFGKAAHLPHDSWTTRVRVMFALSRRQFEQAIQILQDALCMDPFSPRLHARLAWTYHLAGRAEQSMREAEQCLTVFPDNESAILYTSMILAYNGEAARAIELARELVRRIPYFDIATALEAYALARAGEREQARDVLERLQWLSRERFVLRSFSPAVFLELGDVDAALEELRAAEEARCPWFFQMLADPRLARLEGHPEFERMRTILPAMERSATRPRTALMIARSLPEFLK